MTAPSKPLEVNGWTIFVHPMFLKQVACLVDEVEVTRAKFPESYQTKNATKRLAAIRRLAFEVIPGDPEKTEYRQGDTLGKERKHWFRVKFFQQYRLFFRYNRDAKIIVYGWVNDDKTKRAYDSSSDAYRVFSNMLDRGRPPDDWDVLLAEAKAATNDTARTFDEAR